MHCRQWKLTWTPASSDEEVLVLFDRSQLHQAVWKLMENALQHAGRDGVAPHVKIKMEHLPDTGYCLITVEDNGPGIPDDQIEHIFEPFYTTNKQGSGLGLYIARQLCEVNQAELTVDSTPGVGTRFNIRLALARSENSNEVTMNDVFTDIEQRDRQFRYAAPCISGR